MHIEPVDLTYGRLYNETSINLSPENRFYIHMGIKPTLYSPFIREMRICDDFSKSCISVTLFQFVRMLANFKMHVWPKERYEEYLNSDERCSFTKYETLAPKIETSVSDGQRYKFNIFGNRSKFILFDKISLETLLDSEKEIIAVYKALNPEAVEAEYRDFLLECGDASIKQMSKNDARSFVGAKAYEMSTFAIETVLKFWDFLYHFNLLCK